MRRLIPAMLAATGILTAGCTDAARSPLQPDAAARRAPAPASAVLLASGLQGGSGSTVGPGGALFVTEGAVGRISRVDPRTGAVSTFATGLPPNVIGIGGAVDVAFMDGTAYALVTLVGPDVGGSDAVGLYRMDGPTSFTLVADIGAYNLANPSNTPFFIPTGFQYSLESFRGAFLVADGHHNRVLRVTRDGAITEFMTFGNVVPTGMDVHGNTVYMAQAGPVPHLAEDGRVVAFGPDASAAVEVAAGARLLVDVEFGRGRTIFALSQGVWDGVAEGSPALPNTGALVRVAADGTLASVVAGLDRPTSVEIIGNTAYVVTLAGGIWTVDDVAGPPFGASP